MDNQKKLDDNQLPVEANLPQISHSTLPPEAATKPAPAPFSAAPSLEAAKSAPMLAPYARPTQPAASMLLETPRPYVQQAPYAAMSDMPVPPVTHRQPATPGAYNRPPVNSTYGYPAAPQPFVQPQPLFYPAAQPPYPYGRPPGSGAVPGPKKPERKMPSLAAILSLTAVIALIFGLLGGVIGNALPLKSQNIDEPENLSGYLSEVSSYSAVVDRTRASVVEISTAGLTTESDKVTGIFAGAGSGVIISSDGYILTNDHVISGATVIKVALTNGNYYEATLIGTDPATDIALIKISADGLRAVVFGDSDTLRVGDFVIAIGNPLGALGGTVTEGIVSALDREIEIEGQSMRLLQISAAINPGNSGGGLFNMRGELIGIVNAKSTGEDIEGLGFAVPGKTVLSVLANRIGYNYVPDTAATA